MKKLFVGLLAIGSMALVGCSQDEEQLQFGGATFEDFTGEIVSEQTRTSMGADGSVLWSEGDLISLFKKSGYHQNYVVKSYGSASTTFEWVDASTSLGFKPTMNYAAYPYNENNKINGTTLTLDLSSLAAQTYTANTFENAKAVMVAKSATTNLAFTNAFSLANVKLTADCGAKPAPDETIWVKSIKIESATLPLAGNATVDMSQDKPAAVFAAEGAKSITLTCAEPIQLSAAATNFYILMPAVTFPAEDLTITIQADIAEEAKECVIEVDEEIAFLRSQVTTLNKEITLDAWTGSTEITNVILVDDAAEATDALENNAGVKLNDASGTSETAPITVPAKDAVAAEVEHVIDLSSAEMGTTPVYIAVEEGDASTTTVKELEVIVPVGTTASSLNINAPGTTVTITAADGTNIDTITAITAENTLIIEKGVTVNTLKIKKGNIVLKGNVKTIERLADNTDAATIITLGDDIVTKDQIFINGTGAIVLDLNGKTITGTDETSKSFGLIQNRSNLTIKGEGALKLTSTINGGWSRYSSVVSNNPGGNLTIESGVKIQHLGGTDMAYGVDNLTNGKGTSAIATINGATIESTYTGIRQFLNGIEATNSLTVNGGSTIVGAKRGIWMQDPSKNANTGSLVVKAGADINVLHLSVTDGSTEWPVELSADKTSVKTLSTSSIPMTYCVAEVDGVYTIQASKVGSIVDVAGQKAIIYSVTDDAIKAVSVAETTLQGKYWKDAMDWAAGLGEGWALASMEDLNAIYDLRCELNDKLEADNSENALFWEGDELYIKNGSVYYALYMSSTEVPSDGVDANGNSYFPNRVFFKQFNKLGYSDVLYSAFDCINKYAPLRDNYFARGVYVFTK